MFLRFTLSVVFLALVSCTAFGQGRVFTGPDGRVIGVEQLRTPTRLQGVPQAQSQGPIYNQVPGGWVSPNVATGINPQTLGINTSNSQVDNSAFAFGREQGKANKQWVRRPVHGANGQISGYQEGYVWRNPITGQEHGSLKSYTPNNSNGINVHSGVHTQTHAYSGRINSGIHTQTRAYNRR